MVIEQASWQNQFKKKGRIQQHWEYLDKHSVENISADAESFGETLN